MINEKMVYSEVYEFLNALPSEERNKIPINIQNVFKYFKDDTYIKIIKKDIPISKQNLKKETLDIIAMLNIDYLCNSKLEKEFYKKVYKNNEIEYQNEKNLNNIFNRCKNENNAEETQLIEYKKENFFKKIIKKITNIFINC